MFECEVSKPNLKARWFRGEKEIKDLERYEPTSVGTKHMLTVRECEVDDAGQFKVVFEEGVESSAKLTVEGSSSGLSQQASMTIALGLIGVARWRSG